VARTVLPLVTAVFFGMLSTAHAQDEKGKSQGLDKLKGTWTAESLVFSGMKVPEDMLKELQMQLVFTDDKYEERIQGKVNEEGGIKIDTSKKLATIDLMIRTGKDKDKKQVGIYEVKGDTLRLCLAMPGAEGRPTSLSSPEGEMWSYVVFRRTKGKEKE
jgi:uncharacterized protein (TIGR03067 family)